MKRGVVNLVLVLAAVSVIAAAAQGELLVHWKFDESAGATQAADSGPTASYTAVNGGGTPVFGAAGISGNAVQFDGVDDWLQLPYTTDLVNASFTLSFWVNEDPSSTVNQWWLNFGSTHPVYPNITGGNQEAGWQMFHRGGTAPTRLDYRLGGFRESDSKYGWFLGNTVNMARGTGWHHMVVTVEATGETEVLGGRTYYRVNRANYIDGQRITLDTPNVVIPAPDIVGETNILYLPGPTQLVPLSIGARVENLDGATPVVTGPYKGYLDDVQYYTQTLDAGAVAYLYSNPGTALDASSGLIPEDFESYADNTALAQRWSTTSGTISLETTQVQDGAQALRVQTAGAGTVTKTAAYTPDYSAQDGKDIVVWYKGNAANPTGNLTVRVKDSGGVVAVQETVTGATKAADWTELRMERNLGDPNDLTTMELVISAAATMYFDSISFQQPLDTVPEAILEWRLDESSGTEAGDSTAYGNSGTLGSWFTGTQWVANGGNTGNTGDNALSFVGAGNDVNAEVISPTLSPDISNHNSYGINVWVKLNSATADTKIILGGVGDVWSDPGTTANLLPRYIVVDGDTLEPELLRGWSGTAWIYNGFTETISLNEWHMLTVVCNGWTDTIDMYIDGMPTRTMQLVDAGIIDASVAALSPDVFGETQFTAPDGVIDDFTVWKGILPAQGDAPSVVSLWGSYICPTPVTYDFNGDCITDLQDFAMFAASWLECNRIPVSFCN